MIGRQGVLWQLMLVAVWLAALSGCGSQSESSGHGSVAESSAEPAPSDSSGTAEVSAPEPSAAVSPLQFRAVGADAGFSFVRNDDMHGQERIFEVNGGGAAVFDFDGDGWLDIFMTNGCRTPLALESRETPGQIFRNLRQMRFRDVTAASGLLQFGFCTGCAVADVNEDGFEDLYIGAFGPNQFWVNHGDGTFSMRSGPEIPSIPEWTSSVAFGDVNLDGALDLYVANYVVESDTNPKLCPNSKPGVGDTGCSPPHFDGLPDRLLLSNQAGGFVDASPQAGLSALPGKGLGVAICDLSGDTTPEIYVANDGEANFLFTVEAAGPDSVRLTDHAVIANAAFDELGFGQGSMGIAASDFDRNGLQDLFLTHFYGETNTLYENHSTAELLSFRDRTRASGLGPPSRTKVAFGVVPIDADNNGWKDLLVANGHTNDVTWSTNKEPYRMTPQLFQNRGAASFIDVSAGSGEYFQREVLGRGLAVGDLNRDGLVDAVVSQQIDPSVILQNTSPSPGDSLVLKLSGRNSCRTPVAARVTLSGVDPPACEHLVGGGSYQSANANEVHFGLADAQTVDLQIDWPDGDRQIMNGIAPGFWIIRQGDRTAWPLALH